MIDNFVHLHGHSTFSNLDGYGTPYQIMTRIKELGQNACAITDHGNIDAHVPYQIASKKLGIKPIFGCEFYMCEDITEKALMSFPDTEKKVNPHLTVIAKNNVGYSNLLKLFAISYEHGFYYKPRIDQETLWRHQEGLIVFSGCVGGIASRYCITGHTSEAAGWLYGMQENIENFYVELIPIPDLKISVKSNASLALIAQSLDIKTIMTADAHFPSPEDYMSQRILSSVSMRKKLDDPTNTIHLESYMYYGTRADVENRYKKSLIGLPEDVQKTLTDIGNEAIENTNIISNMCEVEIPVAKMVTVKGITDTAENVLADLIAKGFSLKTSNGEIPQDKWQEYWDRINYEFNVITQKGFCDYILIVNDIAKFARDNKSLAICRGSAGGCLMLWILSISVTDSIKYNLSFERFYNTTRSDPPDIDMDFEPEFKLKVIEYLEGIYGKDNVGHIRNTVTYQAKQAIKDVAFVFGINANDILPLVNEIDSKGADMDIQFEKLSAKSKQIIEYYPQLEQATKIIGQSRQNSINAAGVVISSTALSDTVGFIRRDGKSTTSVDKYGAAFLGFLKFDILAVIGLSVVTKACKKIGINPWDMQYLSCGTIEDIQNNKSDLLPYQGVIQGNIAGIFQIDGAAYNILKSIGLDSFEDFYASSALCRPGALNFVDKYSTNKKDKIRFEAEMCQYSKVAQNIVRDTYGVILYQEQVMRFCREMALMEWVDVHAFRKRISSGGDKVDQEDELYLKFKAGSISNGISEQEVEHWWKNLCTHGSYSFNKSHCVTYGIVGYWMSWLKYYYPTEYYWAFCSEVSDKNDKAMLLKRLVGEASQEGFEFEAFNPNTGETGFSIVAPKKLAGGPLSIKGVGESTAKKIIAKMPYTNWEQLKPVIGKAMFEKLENTGITGKCEINTSYLAEVIPWFPIIKTPEKIIKYVKSANIPTIGLISSTGNANNVYISGFIMVKQKIIKAGSYRGKQNIYMLEDETGQMQCRIAQKNLEALSVKSDEDLSVGMYVVMAGNIFNEVFYFNNYVIVKEESL